MNSGSDFSGVNVGDRLWLRISRYEGMTEVVEKYKSTLMVICIDGCKHIIDYAGKEYPDGPQVLFYSKVEIIPPPRPKRLVKKTIEMRPYCDGAGTVWLSAEYSGFGTLGFGWVWCGPVQPIVIEVEE